MENINEKVLINTKSYGNVVLDEPVGFCSIPERFRENSIKRGFTFNMLIVSRRGLGSKTLINSLFNASIVSNDRTEGVNVLTSEVVEGQVKLNVSITTFHDLDNYNELIDHINGLNQHYFEQENNVFNEITDKRIHCCLFLFPNGKLTKNEVNCLRSLTELCNVIPVITKADSYMEEELKDVKLRVSSYLSGLDLYHPIVSIIASEYKFEIDEEYLRGRKYDWGFISIYEYGDFSKLQRMCVYECHDELKNLTVIKFYSKYKANLNEDVNHDLILEKLQSQIEETITKSHEKIKEELESKIKELEK
ncbi:CDC10 [Hepatospora eriocheir]|uniref:CDC10 n=1 Tax=Hepatospora eriocheir TaxID=1081669 RepID=A0A1X0QK52_9MICR|nr:CDC10 [Hepatospora eriocheir]